LYSHNLFNTKKITPTNIIEFIESLEYSTAYCSNILFTLRDFLKCPLISEQFQEGLVNVLNPISFNRYERLPSFYSDEEISKTLLAIDRNLSEGKKDYAIIILAVELALRVSDIRNLHLNEIKWDKNTIELFQQKTGEFLRLYMTDNVKWALLDYLMNVRPQNSKYNNVFLRSKAPYTPYSANASFYKKINKYISLANIKTEGKHHGLHSYRYSLASRLMDEGVSFTVISEALGHKYFSVTKDYTGIDISRLRLVALEVPFNE
jgi:integrase